MKNIVMKGLPKRIAAFMMAVLMMLSLMPIDATTFLAEGADYSFSVKDESSATAVENATINVYRVVDEAEVLVATGTTDEIGNAVVTFQGDYTTLEVGDTYEIVSYGYKTKTDTIVESQTYPIEISLTAYPTIKVSGQVQLPTEQTEGVENAYASINHVELLDAEGNAVTVDEAPVTADVDDATGAYSFENVLAGYQYKLKITSTNNTYDEAILAIDLSAEESDYTVIMEETLSANETLTLGFSSDEKNVYISGTQKTFVPTVKNANDEDVTFDAGYTIAYALKDSTVQNVTVSPDANQNLVVVATEGATAGAVVVTATLTGENYVTVSTEVTVQVKEKTENGDFDFSADGITKNESYEVDYAPDGTCDFNATAKVDDNTTGVTYAVIADGEGEDASVISIDVSTGKITINKVGTATITATLPAIDDYKETTIKIKLTVKPIEQADVTFKAPLTPEGGELTYIFGENSNTYNFEAESTEENATIAYSVIYKGETEDKDALVENLATISGANVSFNQAGTYVVTAKATKANYVDSTVSYTVNITKADPQLVFSTTEEDVTGYTDTVINGKYLLEGYDFAEAVLKSDVGADLSTGVTYESDSDLITVDSDGTITFNDIKDASAGAVDITITATRAEDESYREKSISYTFKVVDWNPEEDENFAWENIYEITGTSNNGWFTKVDNENPIIVSIKDGEEYYIFNEVPTSSTVGEPVVSFDVTDLDDNNDNEVSFYIMDASTSGKGYISAKHTVNGVKVDEITPSITCIKQGEATFVDWLIYFFTGEEVQNEFTVEVEETTTTSALKKYYYISDSATVMEEDEYKAITEWIEITNETEIKIPVNSQSVIYAKVSDEAGNTAYAHTNGLIADNTAPTVTVEEPETTNGYYKADFDITVDVTEQVNLSGIKEVYYTIGSVDGEKQYILQNSVTEDTTVANLADANNQFYEANDLTFTIDADAYNTKDGVKVYIQAVDNADNVSEVIEQTYKICIEEPTISVVYDNDTVANGMYYKDNRTATITINSREDVFVAENVIVTVDGTPITVDKVEWDENQSTTVEFTTDGEHSLKVEYTNKVNGEAVYDTDTFWIDSKAPTGTATLVEVDGYAWSDLLEKLTFGIWEQTTATVKATLGAEENPTAATAVTMQYFVSTEGRILTEDELKNVAWTGYTEGEEVSCTEENIYAVYFKLTDLAGNVKYISTDGFVIDRTNPSGLTLIPEEAHKNDFYNHDVKVGVSVNDLVGATTTSGIKSITYKVTCDGEETQTGSLSLENVSKEATGLVGTFTGELTVEVDEDKNNSENVVVTVYVEDNARNTAEASCTLKVNATAPKVSISYNNNDAKGNVVDGYFFKAGRIATITMIDEAFDNNAINSAIKVVAKDKAGVEIDSAENGVVISGWTTDEDDQSVHTATVEFIKDGYYTVDVIYTNLAGVPNKEVTAVEGTVGALAFAIDTVAPSASILEPIFNKVWNAFLETITFGLYTNEDVKLTMSADDATSKVTIEYFIADEAKTKEQLDAITTWQTYDVENGLTVTEEQKMSVYVKVTDQAGNVTYVNSEGIIVDKTPATITFEAETDKIHKGNVEVTVDVKDTGIISGIKSVEYTVACDGNDTATQSGTLALDGGTIIVDASKNNSNSVVVTVKVVDNAGNEKEETCKLSINTTAPTVGIDYDNNTCLGSNQKAFFNEGRIATVTITDRADSFDAAAATNAIKVVLTDKAGETVSDNDVVISAWETDGNTHTATVKFTKDGYYTVDVDYTNKAGLSNETVTSASTAIAPFAFVIDATDPNNVSVSALGNAWDEFLETITFGLYSKNDVELTITGEDATSDVKIEYYISNDGANKKVADLAQVEWTTYTQNVTISEEQQMTVYVRVTDQAGNQVYVNSNGIVLDKTQAGIVLTPDAANTNGLYNEDVDVALTVDDSSITSGIKTVKYWITCDGTETKRETLYTFTNTTPTKGELKQTFEEIITVNAKDNTGSNVAVTVEVVDNAGNVVTKTCTLSINTTAPTVDISYNNNNSTGHDGGINYFFDELRTATITITDRADSFDAAVATNAIKVVLKDKVGNTVADNGIVISNWNTVGDKHSATVAFTKDGYYTVDVNYINKADLSNEGVTPAQSTVGAFGFVIDTTDPIDVSVSARSNTWEELLEAITFGLYTAEDVVFTIAGDDVTSAVTIEYYITNDGQAKTAEQLAQIADNQWTKYTGAVTISEEQQMAVFVRVTDQAGNRVYVNSDGIVLDKKAAGITLTPEAANTSGVYNSDVDVEISVDDTAITSGIKSVEYWITCDGTETYRETLYTFSKNAPVKSDLLQSYNETITVDAEENNSSNVVVYVKVTDNAGNVDTKSVALDIDITAPTIEVSYDNNAPIDSVNGNSYFDTSRTATIVVTERTNHFDKVAFQSGVVITAKDSKGNAINTAIPTVEFVGTTEGTTADGAKHTFKAVYSVDANYTLEISYTDKAGWICADSNVDYDDSVTPQNFTIDTVAPTGKITVGSLGFWEELLSDITFGLWSPSNVDIVITADDSTSPVKSIEYYKTSTFTALSAAELEDVTDWVVADSFTVSTDDIFVIYAKITDQTGHVQYISSNGIIVDETKPVFETYSPEITITPERPVNGIYDGNVRVDVGVVDPKAGINNAYSGLRTIRYEIYNMGSKTQEGTLYSFSESNPTQDKLLQSWNDQDIVVEAAKNNSNDVLVKVIATDNAGNQSVATTTLKIDITAPKIEVSYDNNNGDASFADSVYYNANRVATIKVTERNFDASAVKVTITNTDGTVPTISGWTTTVGSGNGDSTVHTATVVYSADGDYTFAISAKDMVGNANSGVNYGASQAPTVFTIDKTVPVITVAYDNNNYANENYYKADRTATITINEHNFDASRVVATITATDNGQAVTAPTISNWSKSGDTYTATVSYATDALYTFDIAYSDKAKNQAVDFAEQSFYVDKTMPQLSITEIVDQSANNKDKIGFVITATDTNFDVFNPVLTAVVKTETGFTTQELNIASISDITNGRVYTISNIDADGIYRITCTLVDKAGNAYTEVTLHQADGTPYVESRTAEDTLLTFSVNRDGSVFEVDEATKKVLDNYYVYDVTEDIVIIEVNANRLTTNNVTLNGKELVEGTDFTVSTEGGNGAWLRYSYTLNKELFIEEGEYTIVVSSVDEAENNAFSDVKNAKVAFVVDRTAPVVTISGLETNGKYQTDTQTVTLIPTDDGGAVKSIVVNQVDADGKVIKVLLEELSGDALEDALTANDGQISFDIPSGEYDYIEIACADCSVNAEGDTNTVEILIENVLITESELELIWATYQYAIIASVVAVIAVPTGIVLFRRRAKAK